MSTRKPPAQPEQRLVQAQRGAQKGMVGGRSALAQPVKRGPTTMQQAQGGAAAAAGSSLIGYAEVQVTYSSITSNNTLDSPTAVSVAFSRGTPGVTVISGTSLRICSDGTDSLYITQAVVTLSSGSLISSADTLSLNFNDPFNGIQNSAWVGTGTADVPFTGMFRRTSSETSTLDLRLKCTGGTDRTYSSVFATISVARFADTD